MQHVGLTIARFYKLKPVQRCRTVGRAVFGKYLFFTNAGISMSLSAVGDVIEQRYEVLKGEKNQWDWVRTYRMAISGLTVGMLCHYTYRYLDAMFPGRTLKTVLKKVVVDQIVCSPMCITLFFATLAVLDRSDLETVKRNIIEKGSQLYLAEWMIWPPAQLINFYVLPTRFRVLYDNTISLGFDIYTSYVVHEPHEPAGQRDDDQ